MERVSTTPGAARVETSRVVRRVMLSQWIFTAGHVLTTGGFFNYFVHSFSPSTLLLAALMIAPETAQSCSVLVRRLTWKPRSRKRVWIVCLIAGRSVALLIPASLLLVPELGNRGTLLFILASTAGWYLLQGIAYVNYISWLSDLVPEVNWGRLFSRRQIAILLSTLLIPFSAASLRQMLLEGQSEAFASGTYALFFVAGGLLSMTSVLPLLSLPDRITRKQRSEKLLQDDPDSPSAACPPVARSLHSVAEGGQRIFDWLTRQLACLLACRWWLAFFQGLTQAILLKYAISELHLSLDRYYLLINIMLLTQLPITALAGRLSDRGLDRAGLAVGILLTGSALLTWMLATPEQPGWLIPGYLLWGAFGLVNVCGVNLCLKLSPRSENAVPFALYDQVAGLIAGAAGLFGGFALDRLLQSMSAVNNEGLSAYQVMFLISAIGRMAAALWLLGASTANPHRHR